MTEAKATSGIVATNSFGDVVSGQELAFERLKQMALGASIGRGRSLVLVQMHFG